MHRRANPHRQLNEVETRAYAAGMAARRRGESIPAERLPVELYKMWRMGWNRVGRKLGSCIINRSKDHHTKVEGIHMLRTEAQTLDEALDILAIKQNSAKAAATNRARNVTRKQSLAEQFRIDKAGALGRVTLKKQHREIAIEREAIAEIEQRVVDRIAQIIEMLKFSVEEMSTIAAVRPHYPSVNQTALIDVARRLAIMIKQPVPEFAVGRQAGQMAHKRHCVNCGNELAKEEIDYCIHCKPDDHVRIASELRREHRRELAGLQREAKQLTKIINQVEDAVNERDKGHG